MQGQDAAAAAEYRAALTLRPDMISALAGLAWTLATSPDPAVRNPPGAIQAGERAVTLTARNDATALDALAAAYASAGRLDQAITTARAALTVAQRSKAEALVAQIRARLAAYERRVVGSSLSSGLRAWT